MTKRGSIVRSTLVKLLHRLNGSNRALTAVSSLATQVERIDGITRELDEVARGLALSQQISILLQHNECVDVLTNKSVAIDSPDHFNPWGTARDNSQNPLFNARLRAWIPTSKIRLLDLGCSGGGQVRSFLEQGCYAIGIEGSDYSRKRLRAEWQTIPEFLFTADITEPFNIVRLGTTQPCEPFSVITLWEVIEHIPREKLPAVFDNIARHLAPEGVVIMSVSPNSDVVNGVELHQTIEQRPWWSRTISALGFQNHESIVEYFGNDLVRWHENARDSFHFVLTRRSESPLYLGRFERIAR